MMSAVALSKNGNRCLNQFKERLILLQKHYN